MTTDTQRPSPAKFVFSIVGLTFLAMFATAAIAYLVTSPPREFMFWVSTGFLCTIEFLVGILWVNIFARARCDYRPSGATIAITYGIVGAFAASGLLSIIIYWISRDADGTKDNVFTAVLMGITVFWFIIAALLYTYDLHTQGVARPALLKRAEHRGYARSLKPILAALRDFRTVNDGHRMRIAVIAKKVETFDAALSHSHGGGIGSLEAGRSHEITPEQDQIIQQGIQTIQGILPRLSSESQSDTEVALTEIEQCVSRMSVAVDALGLS